jgi:hypothetical protein
LSGFEGPVDWMRISGGCRPFEFSAAGGVERK